MAVFDLVPVALGRIQFRFVSFNPAGRMPEIVYHVPEGEPVHVNLKDQYWAALLAWLFPGAGHLFQGRTAKGLLFMICIVSTFVFGLAMGRARCVTATTGTGSLNYYFLAQGAVGALSFPAIIQSVKTSDGADPFWVLCERFPEDYANEKIRFHKIDQQKDVGPIPERTLKDGFMAPPAGPVFEHEADVLGMWHADYKHMFDLGVLYTMVAGLLNILAIYDAFCGPAILTEAQKEELEEQAKKKRRWL